MRALKLAARLEGVRWLTLLGWALAAPLAAQEPPPVTGPPPPPDRWNAEVGFALNGTGGNQRITVLTTTLGVTHLQTESFEAGLNTRFRYGRSEGRDVAQNLFGALNLDLVPQARWSPFFFATAEQDPFKKLDLRFNGGSGVKHTFWRNDWDEVSLSGAVLYSREQLEVPDSLGTGITDLGRLSWRGRVRRRFGGDRARIEQVVFYQPVWDDAGDYLLTSSTTARFGVTRTMALSVTYIFERDTSPPPEVLEDDWNLAIGLTVTTRW